MAFNVARIHEPAFIGSLEADGAPFEMVDLSSSSAGSSAMSPLPFSSMVEFSGCSTETESGEDDDFVAGLAEQMAHSMLDDSEDEYPKTDYVGLNSRSANWVNIWGSPKIGNSDQTEVNWSARTPISRPGSFMDSSSSPRSRSPPVLPFSMESRHWDVMSSAVRDHSGLRKEERIPARAMLQFGDQDHRIHSRMHSSMAPLQRSPSSRTVRPPQLKNFSEHSYFVQDHSSVPMSSSVGFNNKISESIAAHHAQKQRDLDEDCKFLTNLLPQQGTPEGWANNSRLHSHQKSTGNCKTGHVKGGFQHQSKNAASHWRSTHPNAGGSGMRAVFLGGSGSSKESSGTGVFLPLSANYHKRKPVCSTVLLPSRIVQVLNLQVDGCQPLGQSRNTASASIQLAGSTPQATTAHHKLKHSSGKAIGSHEQFMAHPHQPSIESRLPSDWKY